MTIKLSDHFSIIKLLRFTMPTMGMLFLTSLYTVVDGIFVANFVGKTAFVAVNLIFPFIMIPATLGTMLGTGGSALIAKTLGEKKIELANSRFSLLIYISIGLGILLSLVWLPLLRPAAELLGARDKTLDACELYGSILIPGLTPMMIQYMFQSIFSLAEKPRLGLLVTLLAGITNVVLDAVFIIVFGWGLAGAAAATVSGMIIGSVVPVIIFCRKSTVSPLQLGRAKFEAYAILKSCSNGASEFMTNVSMSVVSMLYNYQLLRFAGENGVAAYGILMYISFFFVAVFLGYAMGSIPIIGYQFGAKNTDELKSIFRKSLIIIGVLGVILTLSAVFFGGFLAKIFVGNDKALMDITKQACTLYCLSFLFFGFNMFASSFFTALNNGLVSAIISCLRIMVFEVLAVLILPLYLGLTGIWLSTGMAETCALAVSVFFFCRMRKRYQYM